MFLMSEFSIDKCPKSDGHKFYMINRDSSTGAGQKKSRNKLRKMVRSMMLGDEEVSNSCDWLTHINTNV